MASPLRQRLLLAIAGSLERLAVAARQSAGAVSRLPAPQPDEDAAGWPARTQSAGPPAHWLAKVRGRAPWLLDADEQVAAAPSVGLPQAQRQTEPQQRARSAEAPETTESIPAPATAETSRLAAQVEGTEETAAFQEAASEGRRQEAEVPRPTSSREIVETRAAPAAPAASANPEPSRRRLRFFPAPSDEKPELSQEQGPISESEESEMEVRSPIAPSIELAIQQPQVAQMPSLTSEAPELRRTPPEQDTELLPTRWQKFEVSVPKTEPTVHAPERPRIQASATAPQATPTLRMTRDSQTPSPRRPVFESPRAVVIDEDPWPDLSFADEPEEDEPIDTMREIEHLRALELEQGAR